jgi:hypothetical protein
MSHSGEAGVLGLTHNNGQPMCLTPGLNALDPHRLPHAPTVAHTHTYLCAVVDVCCIKHILQVLQDKSTSEQQKSYVDSTGDQAVVGQPWLGAAATQQVLLMPHQSTCCQAQARETGSNARGADRAIG